MNNTTHSAISLKEILNNYPTLEKLSTFKGYKGKLYIYLINSIDFTDYFEGENEPTTIKDRLQLVADTCFSEICKGDANYSKRYGSFYGAFKYWLSGLPSCLSLPVYYGEIIAMAKKIGCIPQNATEKQEDKVCDNFYSFIAVNLLHLFNKYEVKIQF